MAGQPEVGLDGNFISGSMFANTAKWSQQGLNWDADSRLERRSTHRLGRATSFFLRGEQYILPGESHPTYGVEASIKMAESTRFKG
jgi:hypothetical protein